MKRFVLWIAVLLLCLTFSACMPSRVIRSEFEKSVKDYSRMLRWQEIAAAGPMYVPNESREQYVEDSVSIKKRDVIVTDFRVLSMEYYEEKLQGKALVEFDYYILPSNNIKTLSDKQDWEYGETGSEKGWKVKSPLPAFD